MLEIHDSRVLLDGDGLVLLAGIHVERHPSVDLARPYRGRGGAVHLSVRYLPSEPLGECPP